MIWTKKGRIKHLFQSCTVALCTSDPTYFRKRQQAKDEQNRHNRKAWRLENPDRAYATPTQE